MDKIDREKYIDFIDKIFNDLQKKFISQNYPENDVKLFLESKINLLKNAFQKYIENINSQEYVFFNFIKNLEDYKIYLYCFYILTRITYPEYFNDEYVNNDVYQNEYEKVNIGYPYLQITNKDTQSFIYFFIKDFIDKYNIKNENIYELSYDPLLNELIRFMILYVLKSYISKLQMTNDKVKNLEKIKSRSRFSNLYELMEIFYDVVINEENFFSDNGRKGIRFMDENEYISFNNTLIFHFFVENPRPEIENIFTLYVKEITFEKAIELYSIHYSGMPINKVNPDYLKYIINEDTSFIHYSCLNINFRGVNKKIVLLGELHSNEKYNKELVYIKNEFRKICQWNNTNKTNIKVDFLSESTELSNILMLENEQYNIRELVKCTDDENIKKLLTFKNLKFSIPNEYDEFTKERTCNMNKCFYDVYYNSLDNRYISSNYFIKNTDFESYEKFLYRNIFIDYLKTHSNVEKFTNDLYKKVENAINYMKNESLYYNYNTNNNFMVFGYLYEKNSDYAKSLFELYMNSISNNYNILLNYFSFPLNVVQILSKHILDIPPQIVFDYMIYDICNFYNYIYKNYFPYIYYEYRQNPDFTNKVTDLYQRYKHFYGYFPEESSLKKLKNFYTNDLNIFEYKYCKYLIECMVYIDDGFITRYIFLSFKMYNEPLFLSLFIYDPFLQKYLIYMAYLDRLATIRCSYIDVFLIHNILLSNNTEFKKNKKIPSNNNNIVVYCGALHARTLISCFSEIKILNNDNYFCLDDYFTTGNGFVHLNKIPCFSNFLLK